MQIGEQDLPLAQHLAFCRLGFLDLDDHVGTGEYLLGSGKDCRASIDISCVIKARANARAGFDHDLMSFGYRLVGGVRRHADAKFLWFDFFRATDFHTVWPIKRVNVDYGTPLIAQLSTVYAALSLALFE